MAATLPIGKDKEKTIYEIAGYPNWENVVSNMLEFYFTEDEQHKFGRSVFNAFLRTIAYQEIAFSVNDYTDEYTVERETDYIDITIKSKKAEGEHAEWAILVENKIKARLYNSLEKYWNAVKAKNKLGIVLAISLTDEERRYLRELDAKGIRYKYVPYKEFLIECRKAFKELQQTHDDRHLHYFKDFIQNLETHYPDPEMKNELESKLRAFHRNADLLQKIMSMHHEINTYVGQNLRDAMAQFGLKPVKSMDVVNNHFNFIGPQPEAAGNRFPFLHKFRFFVDQSQLYRSGLLYMYFELWGNDVKYRDELREKVEEQNVFHAVPEMKRSDQQGVEYAHLAAVTGWDIKPELENKNLEVTLVDFLRRNCFQEKKGLVYNCADALAKIVGAGNEPES